MGSFDEVFDKIIAMMVVIFRKTLRKSNFSTKKYVHHIQKTIMNDNWQLILHDTIHNFIH